MKTKFNFSSFFTNANYISLTIFLASLFLIFFKGLNYGIDFKGGTLIELRVADKSIDISQIRQSVNKYQSGDLNVKEFGSKGDYLIKIENSSKEDKNFISNLKNNLIKDLQTDLNFRRVEKVGPKVSAELLESGLIAIGLSLAAMLFYIWIRFEWQFSLGSIVALFHDVIITVGIFSFLSFEINLSIIAAVLTIVGYSMNDTVVIYDRIRENLNKFNRITIDEIANLSINETLSRTLITSITTLLALFSIYILGGEILRGFAFAMIIGVFIGTYSSIFVASPILKYLKVSYKTLEKKEEKILP
ncbi:MAG: protein translocase subunit SecF [Candidatus Pelagibacter sp.]|nr:protein translocase subunit SecF [Candidatus Pelagibacter sp.]